MIDSNSLDLLTQATAYGPDDEKIGSVGQVYVDDETGQPSWVTVNTGLFGTSESFVPLQDATLDGDRLRVPYDKDRVKDAPRMASDGHLSAAEEDDLYRYYGVGYASDRGTVTTGEGAGGDRVEDVRSAAGVGGTLDRDTDDVSMTRSEERLEVGKESVEAGRVRLRKYVTTEDQSVSVPVQREVLRVERQPASGETTGSIEDSGEQVEDIVLREERPTVSKDTVAVEEVSLSKDTVTDQETVSDQVRKEQVEVDGDMDTVTDTDRSRGR